MVKIEQLTKRFGSFTAVDNLSFSVEPGTVLGFLGPNGAGKSTCMKMITGFLTPTTGTVIVDNHDIQSQPIAAKKLIGYLPEGAPSYADMTPMQFLKFIAQVRELSVSKTKERIDYVIDVINLQKVMHQPIDTLSKGFKRRVGLAQAILHDPKILVLDEPTDGLDPNQKYEVRELIQGMSADKTIIISTHILEEVAAVCNRAMIIANGRKVADGTPSELEAKSRYHNAVTVACNNPGELSARLSGINGVATVETDTNASTVTAVPRNNQPILPAVMQFIQSNNVAVESITTQKGQLDEVFRDITGGASR